MLLPALSAARESARNTSCINLLSQIGKATFMYSNNNSGAIPGDCEDNGYTHKQAGTKEKSAAYRLLRGGYLTGMRESDNDSQYGNLYEKYFKCPTDQNGKFNKGTSLGTVEMSYNWLTISSGNDRRRVIGRDNPGCAIWFDLITHGNTTGNHPAVTNILYLGGNVKTKELNGNAIADLDDK